MRYLILILLFVFSFAQTQGQGQNCADCDIVLTGDFIQDGNNYNYSPGDVICMQAGTTTGSTRFVNWDGDDPNTAEEERITFINCDGRVEADAATNGFQIRDCHHFRMTGTGDSNSEYGIHIFNYASTGIQIRDGKSTNYEIDHIETEGGTLGWHVVNPFNCNTPDGWERNFIMENVKIHHNYTHNHTGEGFYIGYSNDASLDCDGDGTDETFPMKIRNIHFYNNKMENTQWDAMQIGNADQDVYVYNNHAETFGLEGKPTQDDGMVVNNNAVGDWYNNLIINNGTTGATGGGLSVLGYNVRIYNNVVIDGTEFGIFIGNRAKTVNDYFKVWNNTVINTTNHAIDWNDSQTTNSEYKNNILVDPEGQYIEDSNNGLDIATNETNTDTTNLNFVDPPSNNFKLKATSIAVDAATDLTYFDFDRDSLDRNSVTPWDQGAYEYNASAFTTAQPNSAPSITAISNQVITEANTLDVSISSSDPDSDPLTLSGLNLPGFVTITDNGDGTGVLNIDPVDGDEGTYYEITVITTDDNGASDSTSLIIQVSDDNPSDIIIPPDIFK